MMTDRTTDSEYANLIRSNLIILNYYNLRKNHNVFQIKKSKRLH